MGDLEELMLRTQQTLGTLIAKPKMTDKYLRKPPFRFLHDIIMEVNRTTGFAQGLLDAQESEAGSLSDKQSKIDFLSKVISCTAFCVEEAIDAAPNKIVAGLEPEKTNLWLLQLHRAATEKLGNSEQAVRRVISGDLAVPQKKKKEPPPEPSVEAAPPQVAEDAKRKEEEDRRRKEEEKARKQDELRRKEDEKRQREEQREEERQQDERRREEERRRDEEQRREEQKAEQQRREEEARHARKEEDRLKQREEAQKRQEEVSQNSRQEYEPPKSMEPEEVAQAEELITARHDAVKMERPRTAGRRPPEAKPISATEEIAAKAEELLGTRQETTKMERPRTAGRRPPKVASKEAKPEQAMPATDLILDGDVQHDNEEMFIVQEKVAQEVLKIGDGEAHGSLVRDILEQKKKDDDLFEKKEDEKEEQQGIVMGKLRRKNQKTAANVDAAKLREAIQQLCQSANPLGKSIDLVHQDLGNMSKELEHWRAEYRDAAQQYQQEIKETGVALAPLYEKIALLENNWEELQLNIVNAHARILKNDSKVNNLLNSVSVCAS